MTIDSWCKAILMGFLLSIIGLNPSYANEATEVNHFRVGVLANHGVLQAKQRWQPMMDYLSEQVPNSHFEVVPVDFNGMRSQLLEHDLQFIVTNPGQYLHLSNNFPLSWLATMKSRKHQGSTFTIGATIIVRADSPIRTLQDLRGRNVVASDPQALGGIKRPWGYCIKWVFYPNSFLGKCASSGSR